MRKVRFTKALSTSESLQASCSSTTQTRRHSWDGTTDNNHSLDAKLETNKEGSDEEIENINKESLTEDNSWWWKISSLSRFSNCSLSNNKHTLTNGIENKTTQHEDSEQTSDGEKNTLDTLRHVGLRRRFANSSKHQNVLKSNDQELPKRRSGFVNWLPSGTPLNLQNRLPASIPEDGGREETAVQFSPTTTEQTTESSQTPTDLTSRSKQHRRATVHYSSTGRPSLMEMTRRSTCFGLRAKEHRVLEELKDLCRDYVVCRLRQRNLMNRVIINRQQSSNHSLSQEILFIGNELERMEKNRYRNISKQVGVTLRSEDVLRKVFFELAAEILTTESKPAHSDRTNEVQLRKGGHIRPSFISCGSRVIEITWGRICAVLAVAGGLAVDCVQQGHADLVNQLIEYCGEFAQEEGILNWITSQGGWEALRDLTFEDASSSTSAEAYTFTSLTNLALGFVACAIGAVGGAVAIGSIANMQN